MCQQVIPMIIDSTSIKNSARKRLGWYSSIRKELSYANDSDWSFDKINVNASQQMCSPWSPIPIPEELNQATTYTRSLNKITTIPLHSLRKLSLVVPGNGPFFSYKTKNWHPWSDGNPYVMSIMTMPTNFSNVLIHYCAWIW